MWGPGPFQANHANQTTWPIQYRDCTCETDHAQKSYDEIMLTITGRITVKNLWLLHLNNLVRYDNREWLFETIDPRIVFTTLCFHYHYQNTGKSSSTLSFRPRGRWSRQSQPMVPFM